MSWTERLSSRNLVGKNQDFLASCLEEQQKGKRQNQGVSFIHSAGFPQLQLDGGAAQLDRMAKRVEYTPK